MLASRLSESQDKSVLLIEAGPDAPAGEEHPDICDPFPRSLGNPKFRWSNLSAEIGADRGDGAPRVSGPCVQGYGVGGSSNINGMLAYRGTPGDFEEWVTLGASGWGWQDVLPYFNKLERDLDFSNPLHGKTGPMPIRRIAPGEWAPFSKAMGAAAVRRGYSLIEDCNADFRDGVSSSPISSLPERRVSASMAYLTKSVRARPNLAILANALVERLEFCDSRVSGVIASTPTGKRRFRSHETIVSCGGLQSPAVLMRSGIGPAEKLRELGIQVLQDLPGVGRNLRNKPKVDIAVHLKYASQQSSSQRALGQNFLRYSSSIPGCIQHDMSIKFVNKAAWHPLGRRVGGITVCLHQPYSIGRVELASADPAVGPTIRFNVLSDARDFDRLAQGLKMGFELLNDQEVVPLRNQVFLPQAKIVGHLNNPTPLNWLKAWLLSSFMRSAALRRVMLNKLTLDPLKLQDDEAALREIVRRHVGLGWHVCGTCKMGSDSDPMAVLDPQCRVRGVDGLRVIDASIYPTAAGEQGMHISVLMVAEKMADAIKAAWRSASAIAAPGIVA